MKKTVVKCPGCGQKLRVPEDRGAILVSCQSCSLKWMWEPEEAEPKEGSGEGLSGVKGWFTRAKQGLTGSGANVFVAPLAASVAPGDRLEIQTSVLVAELPLTAKDVRLQVVGEELIALPWHSVRQQMGTKFDAEREAWNLLLNSGKFAHRETIHESEYQVSGRVVWEADAQAAFKTEIPIPIDAAPTFNGRTIACQWRARAVVSTTGVSPKSEWIVLKVVRPA